MDRFSEFGLDPSLLEGIRAIGFEQPTPIQVQAIPLIMQGLDVMGSAQTGTGKTAAFLLPIINSILSSPGGDHIRVLIIVPTRELAMQIDQHLEGLSYFTNVSSMAVYGGSDGSTFIREKTALSGGADVVVCTPGRFIAHLNLQYVKVANLEFLVLDEADRMLDMGFNDDIMKILSHLPAKRQNLLFSATMPTKIRGLAKKVLHNPTEINIGISKPADKILQAAFVVFEAQKIPLVEHLLRAKHLKSVLVFCSTKIKAKELSRRLKKMDFKLEEIHSDLDQTTREKVLGQFKNRELNVLVATDILSRGIDIEDIDLIINYDVPNDGEDYIHRIGRTARAESTGAAFTLINEEEQQQFSLIEKLLGKPVSKAKIPDKLGPGPTYDPRKRPPRRGRPAMSGKRNFRRKKR